jgi:effector-binding domain-containing protein
MSILGIADPTEVAPSRTSGTDIVRRRPWHTASISVTSDPDVIWHAIRQIHEVVMDVVGSQGLAPAGPLFARYHRVGLQIDVEAGIPLAQVAAADGVVVPSELPGGAALHLVHTGDHTSLLIARDALEACRSQHEYRSVGGPWECYVVGPEDTDDSSQWLTEIYLAIRRA